VGLEVHEAPRLSPAGDIRMEDGMVVTVEPGIYIHNLGGVRIEDMIVIDSDVPQVLNKATKDIIVI
jgi:Xaa-Pro aminopeptidase